jgi:hypothetical protein
MAVIQSNQKNDRLCISEGGHEKDTVHIHTIH